MVLKLLKKIEKSLYSFINKKTFKKVNCNIKKLIIGPEHYKNFTILHPQKLKIGDGTVINGDCYINAFGGVVIGKYCHIGKGLTIYSHNHNYKSQESIPYNGEEIHRSVTVGDAVWIGANVAISPGAKIGNGVIISIGSVVFGEVPDCAIVRGNPAQIIGYRDKEKFWQLYYEGKFV